MQDSPLSITASIAGILTFVAAILASGFVRYLSLRNGRVEMERIRKSAGSNVEDLGLVNIETQFKIPWESQEHLRIQEGDGPNVIRMKNLSVSLIITDMIIYTYCVRAMNMDAVRSPESFLRESVDSLIEATSNNSHHVGRANLEVEDLAMEWAQRSLLERAVDLLARQFPSRKARLQKVLRALRRILTAGSSPALVRWYRLRETVLENLRQRDTLRSRILSLQVTMAIS